MKTKILNLLMMCAISLLAVACAAVGSRSVSTEGESDPFATHLKVSSYQYEITPLTTNKHVAADGFFRAFIDKETNEAVYQLYASLNAHDLGGWDAVRFILNNRLELRDAIPSITDLDCLAQSCATYENVVVHFTRAELDSFIATGKPLEFRFTSSTVPVHTAVKAPIDELGVFLRSVDAALGM